MARRSMKEYVKGLRAQVEAEQKAISMQCAGGCSDLG